MRTVVHPDMRVVVPSHKGSNKGINRGHNPRVPVVELQTNFGGGKTHSMLAVHHLFGGAAPPSLPTWTDC